MCHELDVYKYDWTVYDILRFIILEWVGKAV